jgi:hypothetical protein
VVRVVLNLSAFVVTATQVLFGLRVAVFTAEIASFICITVNKQHSRTNPEGRDRNVEAEPRPRQIGRGRGESEAAENLPRGSLEAKQLPRGIHHC